MAKDHKLAWNGIDFDTALSMEQVANMSQRAAMDSTGDLVNGKHRIVQTRSTDREIEFRINDFLISFNKHMVFKLTFTLQGGRTFGSTTVEWYTTTQTTVGGFVPLTPKKMVAHGTYMQFINNLANQIRNADPTARITIRSGSQKGGAAQVAQQISAAAPVSTATPLPAASGSIPPPPAAPVSPVPPPPPAAATVPPPAPVPPAPQTSPIAAVPAAPTTPQGIVTGIPGSAQPTPPRTPVPLPESTGVDLDATRMATPSAPPVLHLRLADGQELTLEGAFVFGRAPAAPASHPEARAVPVRDPNMSVSKSHAVLAVTPRGVEVTDLHSTNGTVAINLVGERIPCTPGTPAAVNAGWRLELGTFEIRLAAE